MTTPAMKTCTKCKQEFPATLEYFGEENRVISRLQARCISCKLKQQRVVGRRWRENNPEKTRKMKRLYRDNNREKLRKMERGYREKSAEYQRKRKLLYRAKNAVKMRKYARNYRENNREAEHERHRHYRENNREKLRLRNTSRRARKRNLPAGFTAANWLHAEGGNIRNDEFCCLRKRQIRLKGRR